MDVVNHRENPFVPSGSYIEIQDSSNVAALLFYSSGSTGVLEAKFHSGAWYRYTGIGPAVPHMVFQGRFTKDGKKAHSVGAAFHQLVINGPYDYKRIEEDQVGALAKEEA